jgi:hypothetical protein
MRKKSISDIFSRFSRKNNRKKKFGRRKVLIFDIFDRLYQNQIKINYILTYFIHKKLF